MCTRSRIRRATLERLAAVAIVAGLVALAAVPAATRARGCSGDESHAALASLPEMNAHTSEPSSGIDLELRVLNLRIEFPWMKTLPITPGRHIVITLLSSDHELVR
jgi:hypothetical protein